jgi:hypothetical protein
MNPLRPITLVFGAAALCACSGAAYPAPTRRMLDAKASARTAELYARANPQARLHVALAKEAITRADALVARGYTRRADFELVRAKSDADLAIALEKQEAARDDADRARANADAIGGGGGNGQGNGQTPQQPGSGGEP